MELQYRTEKITALVRHQKLLVIALGSALLLNFIQAISLCILLSNTRTFLVPPEIKEPFWVSKRQVSHAYLQQMSDYFLSLLLNVTPNTATAKAELLLQFVHPSSYGAVKEHLVQDAKALKKGQISRFFAALSYEANNRKNEVKVVGDVTLLVGQQKVSVSRVHYCIRYTLESGRLLIEEFKEEKEENTHAST